MSAPNVLVLGIDPANKGACLMLAAIRQEIATRFPGARVAVDIATPFQDRLRLGVWAVTPADWDKGLGPKRLKGAVARRFAGQRLKLGLLHGSEIDVVLDASGFAYGDFWGRAKFVSRLGAPAAAWKAEGKKVIALPQAWGPFDTAGFAEAVKTGLARLDLVFARDRQSMAYLQAAGVTPELGPDFTNLLAPALAPRHADLAGAGFIIPNSKMLEARGEAAREDYINFLARAVATLQTVTDRVHILVHEGKKDRALADALNRRLPAPLQIVDPADPLDTKAILAAAGALVSSRFHGLVSALSGGVPSLACGWSHKYEELLGDYDAAAHVVQLGEPELWDVTLARFADDACDPEFLDRLAAAARREKDRAAEVWQKVAAVIAA